MKRLQTIGLHLTVDEVRRRVDDIDEIADLQERAHIEEDRLHVDVLKAIAEGAEDPAGLARAALQSQQLNLDRHYSERRR